MEVSVVVALVLVQKSVQMVVNRCAERRVKAGAIVHVKMGVALETVKVIAQVDVLEDVEINAPAVVIHLVEDVLHLAPVDAMGVPETVLDARDVVNLVQAGVLQLVQELAVLLTLVVGLVALVGVSHIVQAVVGLANTVVKAAAMGAKVGVQILVIVVVQVAKDAPLIALGALQDVAAAKAAQDVLVGVVTTALVGVLHHVHLGVGATVKMGAILDVQEIVVMLA